MDLSDKDMKSVIEVFWVFANSDIEFSGKKTKRQETRQLDACLQPTCCPHHLIPLLAFPRTKYLNKYHSRGITDLVLLSWEEHEESTSEKILKDLSTKGRRVPGYGFEREVMKLLHAFQYLSKNTLQYPANSALDVRRHAAQMSLR
ncbi:hypothetical protein SERLA73DRAFT_77087 [Serpula lacrymans var. lacrymans S7.3]|uniref:Uncharacterized protein n=1 Tax=Serpula lacrymans var. lacrymans (strain S7.3) TaxID=936435 RepID=F8Q924_SERL3|nr:hypothetical protein SERLA73DRAFT_77087 [Serpula lacrymans var. lacrymans S7.3]